MNKIDFDYVALTQALVKCPSVTPNDDGALQIIENHLNSLGFECTRLPFVEEGFYDGTKKWERVRKENSEVLGYKITGKPDVKQKPKHAKIIKKTI